MSSTTDYGKETSCTDVLRTGRYVTGVRLVAEAAYRRLTTPRGTLRGGEEEADYGLDLTELIGSAATKSDASALSGRIKSELSKDERISGVTVDVVAFADGPSTSFTITIGATTNDGPFTLVLAASAVTVELLGIKAAS
jgi:hypothetical protein